MKDQAYVLISACRNEEAYIDGLFDTIAAQTVRPAQWLIVDDGSTDGTSEKTAARLRHMPGVQVVRIPKGHARSFTSQVFAAQHGYELVRSGSWRFIGFLDADIRFEPDYYERLLGEFDADPRLGLGGGIVLDKYAAGFDNLRGGSEDYHVAGGVQFFRRECFEQVGGYVAIPGGGQDVIADVMAMMRGWKVRTFPDLKVEHLRPEGYAKDHVLARGLKWGRKFYLLGYHPLFYLGQCARRLGRRPVVLGSVCQALGFGVAMLRHEPRPVTPEFVRFHRQAQMRRLRHKLVGTLFAR